MKVTEEDGTVTEVACSEEVEAILRTQGHTSPTSTRFLAASREAFRGPGPVAQVDLAAARERFRLQTIEAGRAPLRKG